MLSSPQNCPESVAIVRERITRAAEQSGRTVDSVTLIAASKGQTAAAIAAAAQAGLTNFGENYLQEALEKIATLRSLGLTWHFIGRVQANKTRAIAENFAWVHTVERLKIAERLAEQRPFHAARLNVCLQLHLGGETTKGGVELAELPALAAAVGKLPRLHLRGLMCMPPPEHDPEDQRHWFATTKRAFDRLNTAGFALDTLSMGMSADCDAAIAAGSTMVRIGTAIFGART
ncbi:MAG: YggS family pyridoxal phosphate-dependent enzyme [Pseudomonadales bacterium]|nr:YggS family pyridoxal phosphate-dependent enzyme [Pseudomonadales bacterium]